MWWKKISSLFGSKKEKATPNKREGFIRFFNYKRGYGFIRSRQHIQDIFLHISEVDFRVKRGDQVRFNVQRSEKGYEAKNVELVQS